jgi:hypothetical protein
MSDGIAETSREVRHPRRFEKKRTPASASGR